MHPLARPVLSAGLVVTVALAFWVLIRIWIRLRGSLGERTPSLLKELDVLYRDGRVIARVEGATVDEAAKSVHFERLTGTVNLLNLGPDILDFRSYRLRCVAVESMTGSPPSPYLYKKVTCNIVGQA
jgi:hypothetical protein